jgi:mannose-6-phosphate isomerase-like protein (cupin superfamily)
MNGESYQKPEEDRHVARHIPAPSLIEAAGSKPKRIEEFVGRVNTGTDGISIARMQSPPGWEEPAQTPEFDEYTVVLEGTLVVDHDAGTFEVAAGQAVLAPAGERVRYRTPDGAEYIAVCLPAFSPEGVNREPGKGDVPGI